MQDLLELTETLLKRGQLGADQDLARLERNLGRRRRVEFGETLKDGRDSLGWAGLFRTGELSRTGKTMVSTIGSALHSLTRPRRARTQVLRRRLVVPEDAADDRVGRVAVGVVDEKNIISLHEISGYLATYTPAQKVWSSSGPRPSCACRHPSRDRARVQ